MPSDAPARAQFENDDAARAHALESNRSVLVRAPAGSGKTGLLVQRYLRLLATVAEPEEIVAVTFTRKAAEEMRKRVLEALAQDGVSVGATPFERRTAELAQAAHEQARKLNWGIEQTPQRLRITTLDALALGIARQMPVLDGGMAAPAPSEDAGALYREAARATLAHLEQDRVRGAEAMRGLLRHLLGDYGRATRQIAELLEKRDQWLRFAVAADRGAVESAFARLIAAELSQVAAELGPHFPKARGYKDWLDLAEVLLTQEGAWRKDSRRDHLGDAAAARLHRVRRLAPPQLPEAAWQALRQALEILMLAAAELQLVFRERGRCDFTEITLRAVTALGRENAPTALAARLDARIRHLFVDEFQDTSHAQFELLTALVADWSEGDGRTLFLVGDAMQSIYSFRNAQVGLFQQVLHEEQLGPVPLEVVDLSRNFRSQPELVAWNNSVFLTAADDADGFFAPAASAAVPQAGARVELHAPGGPEAEAGAIAELVREAQGRTAILVFNRNHLSRILPALTRYGVRSEGVKLHSLAESAAVRDLLALTRALAQPADRIAWLAVLRAPWCGLRLASLHRLCGDQLRGSILSLAHDADRRATLPDDERERLEAVLPVLGAAVQQARRVRLRRLVGWCRRQLEAAPTPERELEAAAYLDCLEQWEERGGGELDDFIEELSQLKAPAAGTADAEVQVMTVHEAKGREFDTVIVPSLHRRPKDIGSDLLRWDSAAGLVAAVQATGHGDDAHYKFAGDRLRQLADKEQLRLLYVAATRARHTLHLFGDIKPAAGDRDPHPDSMAPLARIWNQVREQWPAPPAPVAPRPTDATSATPPPLVRVRAVAPPPEHLPPPPTLTGSRPASFQPDLSRRVGEAVHALLQGLAESGSDRWTAAELERELRRAGVAGFEMAAAQPRAARALDATLSDPHGRWILTRHVDDHCEWELSCAEGDYKLDRSFVDAGIRWVIDFKTAVPRAGEDHAAFIARQVECYQAQLRNYAGLVRALDPSHAVRCALFFPMLESDARWLELSGQ